VYFENLYSSELENLDRMDIFLDAHNQPKLNQEAINDLNSLTTYSEIEAVIKSIPTKRAHNLRDLWLNFTKSLKKN
jgi:hypothetical protein